MAETFDWMKNANREGLCARCMKPVDDHAFRQEPPNWPGIDPEGWFEKPMCPEKITHAL